MQDFFHQKHYVDVGFPGVFVMYFGISCISLDIQNPPNTWQEGVKGTPKSRASGDVNGGAWMSRVCSMKFHQYSRT